MAKSILTLGFAALATVADATTVAVIELGKGGAVHRTEAASPTTSTHGVMSFWKSIHDAGSNGQPRKERATPFPGMSAVPDLFNRADGGLAVGILGNSIDLDSMPNVARIVEQNGAVAHLNVEGNQGRKLMKGISAMSTNSGDFKTSLESMAQKAISSQGNKLESVAVTFDEETEASTLDATLAKVMEQISKSAETEGKTIVVHIVVDDEGSSRRRLSDERSLAGDDQAQNDDNNQYEDIASSYGYVSMFQIQYFNVVLWTALGLLLILFSANYMTMHMPLMPDTLLFGESAKMVAE